MHWVYQIWYTKQYYNWPQSLIKFKNDCIARGVDYHERGRIKIKLLCLITNIANEGRLHVHRWDLKPTLSSPDNDEGNKEETKERRKVKTKVTTNSNAFDICNMIKEKTPSSYNIINNKAVNPSISKNNNFTLSYMNKQ